MNSALAPAQFDALERGLHVRAMVTGSRCGRAVSDNNLDYCYSCYTGDYPTELVNIDELMAGLR